MKPQTTTTGVPTEDIEQRAFLDYCDLKGIKYMASPASFFSTGGDQKRKWGMIAKLKRMGWSKEKDLRFINKSFNVKNVVFYIMNTNRRNHNGQVFGRLRIVSDAADRKTNSGSKRVVNVVCECGVRKCILLSQLMSGDTKSCGCYDKERRRTHGMTGTRIYRIWRGMKERCLNKKNKDYAIYGGRGITICKEWRSSFEQFYKDMIDGYANDLQIDRIDTDKGYSVENCRWVTPKVQQNNRRNNNIITFDGESKTISEWCHKLGGCDSLISRRIKKGWSIERALSTNKGM